MVELAHHPNVELLAYSEIEKVEGYIGNFKVTVKQKPRYVEREKCNGCGACVDVCPVAAPNEFDEGFGTRKAIFTPFPQAVPSTYTIDMNRCIKCRLCIKKCEPNAINLNQEPKFIELEVGTIILAMGFREYKPIGEFGYGKYDNVITQLELERIIAPNGPTAGRLVRPSDLAVPKRIAMIQCVGSRSIDANQYCSGAVCCMTAIKNARYIKHYYPDTDATIFYIDIRTPFREYEEYNREARNLGVKFVRGKVAEVVEDPVTKNLMLSVEDTLTGDVYESELDLVVLSTAMIPPEKQDELRSLLKIERATDGFVKEFHLCLAPVDTKKLGVYIAGVAQGPKSIPEAVGSAKGAASSAGTPMINKQVEISMVRAVVDEQRCSGCGLCAEICSYSAITMKNRVASVNEMDCRGCGACAAICPSSAVTLRNYTDEQYEAYLDKLFADQ